MVSRVVIIALEPPSQSALLEKLSSVVPVWVAQSPSTQSVKLQCSKEGRQALFTWFPIKDGESLTDALVRIAFTVDQHYDESSQQPPYDALWAIGNVDSKQVLEGLMTLGFSSCIDVLGGTLFLKSQPNGGCTGS